MPGTTYPRRPFTSNRRANSSVTKYKKKYNKRSDTKLIRSVGWAFPPQYECDMQYGAVITLNLSSGAYTFYGMRCNGIFDPDGSTTGGSCLYYDKLNTIYGQNTVISSHLQIQPASPSSVANAITLGVYTDDDGSWATTMQSALNRPKVRTRTFNTLSGIVEPIDFYWSAKTAFGNDQPWTDDQLTAQPSALPAEQMNFIIFAEEATGLSCTLFIRVKIIYRVRWFELMTTAV